MRNILYKLILLFTTFFLWNCGFEVLNKSTINNIYFKKIETQGDKRVNFKIKNNLLLNSKKENKNVIILKLQTKKDKKIKEKNIKNEIRKYEIILTSNLEFNLSSNNKKKDTIQLTVNGDYLVGNNNLITLNNEKKLIENLIEKISEDIMKSISSKINDI